MAHPHLARCFLCRPSHALYFASYEAAKELYGGNREGHRPLATAAAGACVWGGGLRRLQWPRQHCNWPWLLLRASSDPASLPCSSVGLPAASLLPCRRHRHHCQRRLHDALGRGEAAHAGGWVGGGRALAALFVACLPTQPHCMQVCGCGCGCGCGWMGVGCGGPWPGSLLQCMLHLNSERLAPLCADCQPMIKLPATHPMPPRRPLSRPCRCGTRPTAACCTARPPPSGRRAWPPSTAPTGPR